VPRDPRVEPEDDREGVEPRDDVAIHALLDTYRRRLTHGSRMPSCTNGIARPRKYAISVRFPTSTSAVTGIPGLRWKPAGVSCRPIWSSVTRVRYHTALLTCPAIWPCGIGTAPDGFRCSSCALKLSGLMVRTTPCAMPYCV